MSNIRGWSTLGRNKRIEFDDILDNRLYIDGVSFERFFYHNTIPTWYFASRSGQIFSDANNVIMSPSLNGHGYPTIGLRIQGFTKPKYQQIHMIVATVYCGGWHKGLVVDHIDANPLNNHADNLHWVTPSENVLLAYNVQKVHKIYYGDHNHATIYPDIKIREACKLMEEGKTFDQASEISGVPKVLIQKVVHGESRVNISKDYVFPDSLTKSARHPLDDDVKQEIKRLYESGHVSPKEIQEYIGTGSISQIIHAIYDDRYNRKK